MTDPTPWHLGELESFDLETTGIDVFTARIVTASLIELDGTRRSMVKHDWIANPGVPIPEAASAVHGITDERAQAEGRPPAEVIAEINAFLESARQRGVPIVGFNLVYDLSLLRAESERHGLTPVETPLVVDAMVLDKRLDKYRRGGRRLTDVAAVYGVSLDNAHSADADSLAAARVAYQIAVRYPDEVQIPLAELHEKQREWFAIQAREFQTYKRAKGDDPNLMIPPQWPVRLPGDDMDADHSPYAQAPGAERASSQSMYAMSEGWYALDDADGKTHLYKIDKPTSGKWAGRTFIKEQYEGELALLRGAEGHAVLAKIDRDPMAATVHYGRSTGMCGRCARPLTDPESIAAGIGPVCASK